jgi:hypothetical protein
MTEYSRWNIDAGATITPEALTTGDWHVVDDETSATGRFYVRVGYSTDGKLIVTGLLLGDRLDEISSNTLRAVNLGEIIKTIQWRESGYMPPRSVGAVSPLTGLARFEGMTEAIEASAEQSEQQSRRGRRAPKRAKLEEFALAYRRHTTYSVAAMSLAARDVHISRATANRWAARCRDLNISLQPNQKAEDE